MRLARGRLLRLALLAGTGAVTAAGVVLYSPYGCGLIGGRWGSAEGRCTTPLCFYVGNCGHWLWPSVPCASIRPGTPEARVHFLLGSPQVREGRVRVWTFGKPDELRIRGSFEDGRLATLSCGELKE